MNSNSKISVVIPSIGNRTLNKTLDSINNSSIIVDEIIVSLPPNSKFIIDNHKKHNNIKIHYSKFKGQVSQRIDGFKKAKNNFVLQIDDDIILEKKCLELKISNIQILEAQDL